jgi:hypothetical protein
MRNSFEKGMLIYFNINQSIIKKIHIFFLKYLINKHRVI